MRNDTVLKSQTHAEPIFNFVTAYYAEHGIAPTLREIGAAVGITSTDHVSRDVRWLVKQGWLVLHPHAARGLRLPFPLPEPKPCRRPRAPLPRRYGPNHCHRCGIKSRPRLCSECVKRAPIIQTHLLMGDARFGIAATPLIETEQDGIQRARRILKAKRRAKRMEARRNEV